MFIHIYAYTYWDWQVTQQTAAPHCMRCFITHKSGGYSMDIHRYLWSSIDIQRYHWNPIEIHRYNSIYIYVSIDIYEILQISIGIYGQISKYDSTDVHRYQWIFIQMAIDINGILQISIDIYGILYRYPKIFVELYRYPQI